MAQKKKDLPLPASLQGPFLEEISTVYPGRLDSTNQFLPAVSLDTSEKRQQDGAQCSGVLLSPRLVLTAGHCVCLQRKVVAADRPKIKSALERALASQSDRVKAAMVRKILPAADTIIDGSSCARLAMVMVATYVETGGKPNRQRNGRVVVMNSQYKGEVLRPHPDFMIVQDGKNSVFKESDLAIVVLNEPVAEEVPPVKLPGTEVQQGMPVTIAGFGYGKTEQSSRTYGDRHVADSMVVAVVGSDSPDVQFAVREEPGDGGVPASIYHGDSGGPCFSKSDKEILLGIATGITTEDVSKKLSLFTSVYPARDWVRRVAKEMGETVQ